MLRAAKRFFSLRLSLATLVIISFSLYTIWHLSETRTLSSPETISIPTSTPIPEAQKIPKKLWYKLGPKGLSDQSRAWIDTCLERNPDYQHEFLTDESADVYVRKHFSSRADIIETYFNLTIPILKADILRYLLLFVEGGFWSDLDVSCEEVPIGDWIPVEYRNSTGMVLGWEFDVGWFRRQFATWTIGASPGSRHMAVVIDDVLSTILRLAHEHNCTIADLHMDMIGDVIDVTGPVRFTRSILASLKLDYQGIIDIPTVEPVYVPRIFEDVLILPGYAFAEGINKYPEGHTYGPKLVTHHYAGTWKNEQGGEVD
ncbi:Initiation-specific alpha-1,6-mannosyltransferase [Lachnellula suecica]|uniref:Initiation-specific alpha-1,6-mannosyltransferase n=1 Tax=Lachnellula suecica TaxID=602035 RepID=A0A8T9BZW6_9HELO|nr:Initiation-specific alpha-1,6-mannosyltransferase [Lachnellula suecica]